VHIVSSACGFKNANADAATNVLVTPGIYNQPSDVKYKFLTDVRGLRRGSVCILDQSVMGTCPR
jgi:hypothetical protein